MVSVITIILAGTVFFISKSLENSEKEIPRWVTEVFNDSIGMGNISIWKILKYICTNIDLLTSIQHLQLVFKDAISKGLDIGLIRLETGTFQVIELNNQNTQIELAANWYHYIYLSNNINLYAISIHYIDLINTNLSGYYQLDDMHILQTHTCWITKAAIQLPDKLGKIIILYGEIEWLAEASQICWRYKLRVEDILLQQLLRQDYFQGIHIYQGSMTASINIRGINAKINDLNFDLVLKQANLVAANRALDDENVLISRMKGSFAWQRKQNNWRFTGKDITLDINSHSWPITSFIIEQYAVGHLFAEASYIKLSDLKSIISLTNISPQSLREMKLSGDMISMRLEYDLTENYLHNLEATLANVKIAPWGGGPGIDGLSGLINWHDNISTIYLNSNNMTLNVDKWLKDSIFFDTVSGRLRLKYVQNWQIEASELRLSNDDFSLQFDGELKYDSGITDANFTIKINHIDIKNCQEYIPRNISNNILKYWSSSTFIDGEIIDGFISFTGNLANFPFSLNPGQDRYNMALNIKNINLHNIANWPNISIIEGTIIGNNNFITLKSHRGNISGFNFFDAAIKINNYIDGRALLMANLSFTGTTQQALDFLQKGPLKSKFRNITSIISDTGDSDIKLTITVPLLNINDIKYHGYISFNKSRFVNLKYPKFILSDVTGKVRFNNIGILARKIRARLLDQDININISFEESKIAIYVDGLFKARNLNKYWNEVLPKYVFGQAVYKLKLLVYEKISGKVAVDVAFKSDLMGIGIDMPAPLGKKRYQRLPFSLSLKYHEDVLVYSIDYDDILHAVIVPGRKNKHWRGEICFGEERAIIPNAGMVIKGRLDKISIDDWLSWKEKNFINSDNSILAYIDIIYIYISQIQLRNQQITELLLTAKRADKDWIISIYSNQASGDIIFVHNSDSSASLSMNFDHIYLEAPKDNSYNVNLTGNSISKINLFRNIYLFGNINLNIRRLYFGNIYFGKIALSAVDHGIKWGVNATISNPEIMHANIQGQWHKFPMKGVSHFNVIIDSDNFKKLLADFGYRPIIEANEVNMQMDLFWPGDLTDFSRKNIVGKLTIKVDKGIMIGVNPGITSRIFRLFSITSIIKMLSLNFKGLFSDDVNFMSIHGKLNVSDGIIYTNNISIYGEFMKINIFGSINIIKETYSHILIIQPDLSSLLPIAGALIGGLTGLGIGGTIFIIDKIINEIFDIKVLNLISYSYSFAGTSYNAEFNITKHILK